jgi:hypothetical protein
LRVNKGRGVRVADTLAFIILIEAWVDFTNIAGWDRRKSLSIQILDKDLRSTLIFNIDGKKVFETIELIDNIAFS